jgi:hypothetical protein
VRFTWAGFDGRDPAFGAGSAQLAPDGPLTGEIRFHRGDEATFKAVVSQFEKLAPNPLAGSGAYNKGNFKLRHHLQSAPMATFPAACY